MKKHKEKLDKNKVRLSTGLSFLIGFSQALLTYIMSSYFEVASGIKNIGGFYFVAYLIFLIVLFNLHRPVEKFGKSNVLTFSLIIKIIAISFLALYPPGWLGAFFVVIYIISSNLNWVSLDMILESYSSDRKSGRIRGEYLTIMNLGIFLGPLISVKILEKFDYSGIFITILFLNLIILFIESKWLKVCENNLKVRIKIKSILRKIVKRKNICRIFYISFILDFFYALMIIYTPIYLLSLGMSWGRIGIIFTIMLLPFMFLQYPAGILADKKMGEKEMLFGSIIIMGISTLTMYFVNYPEILIWTTLLFASRIGASLVEILRDSYFYKRIDGDDIDIINIFRTARPLAYIIASILSAVIIYAFSIKAVFILTAVVVLSALYSAFRLQDNPAVKEM